MSDFEMFFIGGAPPNSMCVLVRGQNAVVAAPSVFSMLVVAADYLSVAALSAVAFFMLSHTNYLSGPTQSAVAHVFCQDLGAPSVLSHVRVSSCS